MGVQLAQSELDSMQQWQVAGKTPVEIHQRLAASRRRRSKSEPDLTTLRRALKGTTVKKSPLAMGSPSSRRVLGATARWGRQVLGATPRGVAEF